MDRRQFSKLIGMSVVALRMGKATSFSPLDQPSKIAITLDDFNISDFPTLTGAARNQAILDALEKARIKAGMFVMAKNVADEKNMTLLRMWNKQGHLIANHTYSHLHYPSVSFQEFTEDILRAETLLKRLPHFRKYFRFPYLKEGKTAEQRDMMRSFLREHGYRNGHVTIDASDWYVDGRLRERLKKDPRAEVAPYREYYLAHLWDRATYYDELAQKVLGRKIKHTLLLHHNVLNGMFLGDVLEMFRAKGWKLINVDEAYADPVFSAAPAIAPAGESLVWALAKETGRFENTLRYPGEDGDYEKPGMDALGL